MCDSFSPFVMYRKSVLRLGTKTWMCCVYKRRFLYIYKFFLCVEKQRKAEFRNHKPIAFHTEHPNIVFVRVCPFCVIHTIIMIIIVDEKPAHNSMYKRKKSKNILCTHLGIRKALATHSFISFSIVFSAGWQSLFGIHYVQLCVYVLKCVWTLIDLVFALFFFVGYSILRTPYISKRTFFLAFSANDSYRTWHDANDLFFLRLKIKAKCHKKKWFGK